jgi:hypothetical protein
VPPPLLRQLSMLRASRASRDRCGRCRPTRCVALLPHLHQKLRQRRVNQCCPPAQLQENLYKEKELKYL